MAVSFNGTGLTLQQQLAVAAVLACKPCCRGSGSGDVQCEPSQCCWCCVDRLGNVNDSSPAAISMYIEISCLAESPLLFTLNRDVHQCLPSAAFRYLGSDTTTYDGSCVGCSGPNPVWEGAQKFSGKFECPQFVVIGGTAITFNYSSTTVLISGAFQSPSPGLYVADGISYEMRCRPLYLEMPFTIGCAITSTNSVTTSCNSCVGATGRIIIFE